MVQIINPETNYLAAHSGGTPSNWYIDNEQGDVTINYDIDMDILQNFIPTNNVDSLINVTWPARQTKTPTWKVDTDNGDTFRYTDAEMYDNLGVTCAWGSGTPSFNIVKEV